MHTLLSFIDQFKIIIYGGAAITVWFIMICFMLWFVFFIVCGGTIHIHYKNEGLYHKWKKRKTTKSKL